VAHAIHAGGRRRWLGAYADERALKSAIERDKSRGGMLFDYRAQAYGQVVHYEVFDRVKKTTTTN
jgi:hypothetical protein